MNFGELIGGRRRELGLTLEDVARAVGVDRATVLRWERGEIRNARRDKLTALAARLALPVSALLDGEGGYQRAALCELPVMDGVSPDGRLSSGGRTLPVAAAQLPDGEEECFLWQVAGEEGAPRFLPGDLLLLRRTDAPELGRGALVLEEGRPLLCPDGADAPAGARTLGVVSGLFRTL